MDKIYADHDLLAQLSNKDDQLEDLKLERTKKLEKFVNLREKQVEYSSPSKITDLYDKYKLTKTQVASLNC